jgi:hypothetical protein
MIDKLLPSARTPLVAGLASFPARCYRICFQLPSTSTAAEAVALLNGVNDLALLQAAAHWHTLGDVCLGRHLRSIMKHALTRGNEEGNERGEERAKLSFTQTVSIILM